jgi:hypothetical protein
VNLYGPDGVPLATLRGLDPSAARPQWGRVSGWHVGRPPRWSFMP